MSSNEKRHYNRDTSKRQRYDEFGREIEDRHKSHKSYKDDRPRRRSRSRSPSRRDRRSRSPAEPNGRSRKSYHSHRSPSRRQRSRSPVRDDRKERSEHRKSPTSDQKHRRKVRELSPEKSVLDNATPDDISKLFGFGSFGSTKNSKVEGNDLGTAVVRKARSYRQYMNRRDGFNRNLSPKA